MASKVEVLIASGQEVFNTQDLSLLWQEKDSFKVNQYANYYTKVGKIFRIKNGLYSLNQAPEPFLVAQKALTPSYISFHSALSHWGINFQYYNSIHSISNRWHKIVIKGTDFFYHQIKPAVMFQPLGIINKKGFSIAGAERAICDTLYLAPDMTFDNLNNIDWEELTKIALIYEKGGVVESVEKLRRDCQY